MVEYHEWVKICFAVAKTQGFDASFDNNTDMVSVAADIWNDRNDLRNADTRTAEKIANREISVS